MKQKVVVIGHGYTSRLGVIRSVAEIGCNITVIVMTDKKRFGNNIDTTQPIDCYSKYVNSIYYCYKKDEEGLVQLLLDKCVDKDQKAILIPDSDFSASVIDKNLNRLCQDFLVPHIHHTQGEVMRWMDKGLQKNLAKSLGLNVAAACEVDIIGGKYNLPFNINYPCFPKPQITILGDKYMKRCDNEEQLRAVIEHLGSKRDNKVLVEDYKAIEEEYALLGFSDGSEVIIPGIIHFLTPSKSHFGLAMRGEIMPIEGFEDLLVKLNAFVKSVGYVGVFDIDFFKSEGIYYFGEMNLRFGGSGYAVTKMGVNLPAMMVKSFSGESIVDMNKEVTKRATFINERMCTDDWYQGFLTTEQYHRMIKDSDICFVADEQDPSPQKALEKKQKSMVFRRKVRNVLRRIH